MPCKNVVTSQKGVEEPNSEHQSEHQKIILLVENMNKKVECIYESLSSVNFSIS